MRTKQHVFQVLLAVDQLANAIFGGWCDESLSSRAHRLSMERNRLWPKRIINTIFCWQEDHCKEAYESELERLHVPPQMRKWS